MEKETIVFELVQSDLFDLSSVKPNTKVKIKYDLLHTLPHINQRNRCITLPTLINSLNNINTSGEGELINFEHQMEDSGIGDGTNEILGFSSKAFIPDLIDYGIDTNSEIPLIPSKSIPLKMEGVLWSRNGLVKKIINQQKSGVKKWQVSVEIAHDFKEGAFYLPDENKFIAVKDAPSEMIECYSADGNITLYKGKKLAFAWGGERGSVHIAGTGITCNPADRETKLELCIASMSGEPILGKGGDKEMTIDLMKLSVEEINNLKFDLEELDLGSKWTRAYINDLPDSAFAIVSASVKKETDNKSKYRGFPYKDVDGKIDLAHIRNALARIAQAIKGNSSDFTNEELLAGQKKLVSAAIKSKIGDYASSVEEDYNSLMKWINIWEISRVFENEFGDLSNEIKESLLQAVILEEKKLIPSLVTVLGTTLSTNAIAVTKEEINSLIIEAVKLEKQKWEDEIQLEKDTQVKLQDRMNILHEEKFDIASEELISRIKGIPINEEGDKKFQAELTYMKSLRVVPKVDTNSLRSSIFSFPGGSFGNKGNGDGKENLDKKVENNTKINPMVLAL